MAMKIFKDYQKANLRKSTIVAYGYPMNLFEQFFGGKDLRSLRSEDLYHFLEMITEGNAKSTKGLRFAQLRALLNFIIMNCYTAVRGLIKAMGRKLGVELTPHDLRRHSATFASRNGVPIEIVSKVLLRHQNLKTTQLYLGKVTDSEAIRWMDMLHGE
jgi:integrase